MFYLKLLFLWKVPPLEGFREVALVTQKQKAQLAMQARLFGFSQSISLNYRT